MRNCCASRKIDQKNVASHISVVCHIDEPMRTNSHRDRLPHGHESNTKSKKYILYSTGKTEATTNNLLLTASELMWNSNNLTFARCAFVWQTRCYRYVCICCTRRWCSCCVRVCVRSSPFNIHSIGRCALQCVIQKMKWKKPSHSNLRALDGRRADDRMVFSME